MKNLLFLLIAGLVFAAFTPHSPTPDPENPLEQAVTFEAEALSSQAVTFEAEASQHTAVEAPDSERILYSVITADGLRSEYIDAKLIKNYEAASFAQRHYIYTYSKPLLTPQPPRRR